MTILAIVGMPGSGKSELARYLKSKGLPMIRLGGIIVEEVEKRGLLLTPQNERIVREDLRRKSGMDAIVQIALPHIKISLDQTPILIIDGLYSFSEYKTLKRHFNNELIVISVFSPPRIRYQRLGVREERPLSIEEARERDYLEIETIEKAGPIAMADYVVLNIGTKSDMFSQLDDLSQTLGIDI